MAQNRARMPRDDCSRAWWHNPARVTKRDKEKAVREIGVSRGRGGKQSPARLTPWYTLLQVEGGSRARGVQFRARLHGDDNARKERHAPDPGRTEKVADKGKANAYLLLMIPVTNTRTVRRLWGEKNKANSLGRTGCPSGR